MVISIKTAMKCVKQAVGGNPEHYAIVFLKPLCYGVNDAIEYNFDNKQMDFGFVYRE